MRIELTSCRAEGAFIKSVQNSGSLTALRGFRLLRVVKLAKNITSFHILVKAIAQTVVSLLPLFVRAAFAAAALLQQWRFWRTLRVCSSRPNTSYSSQTSLRLSRLTERIGSWAVNERGVTVIETKHRSLLAHSHTPNIGRLVLCCIEADFCN